MSMHVEWIDILEGFTLVFMSVLVEYLCNKYLFGVSQCQVGNIPILFSRTPTLEKETLYRATKIKTKFFLGYIYLFSIPQLNVGMKTSSCVLFRCAWGCDKWSAPWYLLLDQAAIWSLSDVCCWSLHLQTFIHHCLISWHLLLDQAAIWSLLDIHCQPLHIQTFIWYCLTPWHLLLDSRAVWSLPGVRYWPRLGPAGLANWWHKRSGW